MKKVISALLAFVLIFSLAACKKKEPAPTKKVIPAVPAVQTDEGKKAAEENAQVLEGYEPEPQELDMPYVTEETVKQYIEDNGGESVVFNDDGSIEMDLTDAEYNTMMENLGKSIRDKLETIRKSSDIIESVQVGLNYDKYYIFVDKAAYEANPDVIDIKDCCESAELYHILRGYNAKNVVLTLYIMNKDDDIEIARKVYKVA